MKMQQKKIKYEELLQVLKKLPADQLLKIQSELEKESNKNQITDFREFLLRGPVMSEAQYKLFKENRKSLNQWRRK
jgi:hypothetical protein